MLISSACYVRIQTQARNWPMMACGSSIYQTRQVQLWWWIRMQKSCFLLNLLSLDFIRREMLVCQCGVWWYCGPAIIAITSHYHIHHWPAGKLNLTFSLLGATLMTKPNKTSFSDLGVLWCCRYIHQPQAMYITTGSMTLVVRISTEVDTCCSRRCALQ